MAEAIIREVQKSDVAACVKHYAINTQELNRKDVDMRPDERTLREIYLPAFEAAVKDGGVLTVMGAYNEYMGDNCNQSRHLVMDILKGDWGFEGVLLTDWHCHINTLDAANNGLDIEMGTKKPYNEYHLADPFLAALKDGNVSEKVLDDKVRRILRVQLAIGMMDGMRAQGALDTEEHRAIARRIAEETVVLLKNDTNRLPLNEREIKNLLVLGHNADKKHSQGGGSSKVKCRYEITPLEGLRQKLGDRVKITYMEANPAEGYSPISDAWLTSVDPGPGSPAWKLEGYNEETGKAILTEYLGSSDATETIRRAGKEKYFTRAVLSATIKPLATGKYDFITLADGYADVCIDGKPAAATLTLEANREYAVQITYSEFKPRNAKLYFGWKHHGETNHTYLEAAKSADAVIYFGGIDHSLDKEGQDKPNLKSLDGSVPEKLLAVRPDTILFMIGGSPVEMPWIDQAQSLLWGFYGGMEGGHAYADILFGDVNPSAKLPISFPKRLKDSPAQALADYNADTVHFKEGIFIGYRWYEHQNIEPLFPFEYGLSYTDFTYSNLELSSPSVGPGSTLQVSYTVTNCGFRFGQEVAQLYIQDVEASVERPVKELKGFAKVALQPGESKVVRHNIDQRALSFWDTPSNDWKAEPGAFNVLVGPSSERIALLGAFTYQK
jgi:beta-glucosidase